MTESSKMTESVEKRLEEQNQKTEDKSEPKPKPPFWKGFLCCLVEFFVIAICFLLFSCLICIILVFGNESEPKLISSINSIAGLVAGMLSALFWLASARQKDNVKFNALAAALSGATVVFTSAVNCQQISLEIMAIGYAIFIVTILAFFSKCVYNIAFGRGMHDLSCKIFKFFKKTANKPCV